MNNVSLLSRLGIAGAGLVLVVALVAGAAGAGVASLLSGGDETPSAGAATTVPPAMLALYQQAAATCPGLPWTVLAAIGTIESDNGTSDAPGVSSGTNSAGAEGPMQFEPATFAEYDEPVPPGGADPPSPYDATDAVYAAARELCANGAKDGSDLDDAIFSYNHSASYVAEVLDLVPVLGETNAEVLVAGTAPVTALDWALAQVGTPYVWGGETPGVGFDCSGLVQAAYAQAGVTLPRTAQAQFDATTRLAASEPLEPGDLLFFGTSATNVTHVGIYLGTEGGQPTMVDAPDSGSDVRIEPFPSALGASFGSDVYLGATVPD